MKKFWRGVYYVVLACLIALALLLIISAFPITGNFKIFVVQSGSMEPNIHTGSIVAVKPADAYKVDEIITFRDVSRNNLPVTHRVKDIRLEGGNPIFITKGDANKDADSSEVPAGNVLGRVLFSVPYVGYAVDTAKKPYGFLLIIIVPALLVIYDEARKIRREMAKMRAEKNKPDGGENAPQ